MKKLLFLALLLLLIFAAKPTVLAQDCTDLLDTFDGKSERIIGLSKLLDAALSDVNEKLQRIERQSESLQKELVKYKARLLAREKQLAELQALIDEYEKRPKISEEELRALEKRFDEYAENVQATVRGLEAENIILKVGCGVLGAGLVATLVYIGVKTLQERK